jgi:malate dehydrogenase
MVVPTDGSYDIGAGIVCGLPCSCRDGEWSVVQGLDVPDFSRQRIDASVMELQEERDAVSKLGLI